MKNFRAPAFPLIAVDPYFNIWQFADKLYDDVPRHWTGQRNFLTGVISIDGEHYRFMGKVFPDSTRYGAEPDVIEQTSVEVRPLTTVYTFENEKLDLKLEFMTPLIPDDLMLLSRPISYITYTAAAKDGKDHEIRVYIDASFELCVNTPDQKVTFDRTDYSVTASSGTRNMLKRSGDDHRIEWGTLHLMAPEHETYAIRTRSKATKFREYTYPSTEKEIHLTEGQEVVPMNYFYPALACEKTVNAPKIEGIVALGYDDVKSIQYFYENIEAYWRKDGATFEEIAKDAIENYASIKERADKFDAEFIEKASKVNEKYAQIVSLAYRQTVSAHKLTYHDGEVQFFSKENYSNGCIATVDVTYPSIPLFLIYNPTLVEGMLNPIFKLCELGLWEYEFAPHDAGQYPLANSQVYGWSSRHRQAFVTKTGFTDCKTYSDVILSKQMPIEECGNMILCVATLCKARKDDSYAVKHYDLLTKWADYLVSCGYDPENQLCTDDFAGHLAHNCNLSIKAIEALAAWAQLIERLGKKDEADFYRAKAEEFAKAWQNSALEGDHYRLAFDQKDSWSIKYNLVWDNLLDLNVFDKNVAETEVNYYLTKVNKYGVPLDVRADYTKSDWQMWSTVLCDNKEYLDAVVDKMYDMLENTRDRVPFTDWYFTSTPYMRGFQCRSVQGGLFINLLKF